MTSLFARYSRLTVLMVLLVLAAGLGSLLAMGRQEDPTLIERYGLVLTPFPGATAERVEALVTEPLEARLLELGEVTKLISESRPGLSIINVELREDLSPAQVDQSWTLVRDQVELARQSFPAGALTAEVERQYVGAATMIVALSWSDGDERSLGVLTRMAEDLEDRLQVMGSTEETQIYGEAAEEIRVLPDADALAALGLSASDVAARIAGGDPKEPAGQVRGASVNLGVQVIGELDSVARVREIPVLQTPSGDTVRVGDIARVERDAQYPPEAVAVVDGGRSVLVAAFLRPNSRADLWTEEARAIVDGFIADTPAGVDVDIIFEQNAYVDERLSGLAGNLALSALIVFAVLFFMMGWRAAFIVGTALPLTTLLVLFLINFIDQPLHQMSVTGLVIALGLLIDNAIVMVHEYRLKRGSGLAPIAAVDAAVSRLFAPLLASTVTTMLAFAPIALMPGSAGEFVGMIGVSVIFAVASSLFLAMTVVPAFAAWFDDGGAQTEGRPRNHWQFWRYGLTIPPLASAYASTVRFTARVPFVAIVIAVIVPVIGFWAASRLPVQFFPPTDRDMFQLSLTLPSETSIEETRRVTDAVTAMLEEYEVVEHVGWVLGTQPPRTYYNVTASGNGQPNFAAGWVRTPSPEQTREVVKDFAERARDAFPQAQLLALPFEQGPPINAPVEIHLYGPDVTVLNTLGEQIRAILVRTENVTYTTASIELGAPVAKLQADEAAVALSGLRLTDLAGIVRADLDGVVGGGLLEGAQEVPVRVVLPNDARSGLDAVRGKAVPGVSGELGPSLESFGPVTLEPEVAVITRENAVRRNTISGFVQPYTLPDKALSDFRARYQAALDAGEIEIPAGYRLAFGGEADSRGQAVSRLAGTAVPLLVLMAGALVLAFNSFRYASVVGVVAFLSVGLAFLGVALFGQTNGFMAIIGALGLMGLAVNGAIVVLSALKNNPDAADGDPDAITETTVDATRHIISTTLTTIGGFTPLLLFGANFWMPLATAVVGGVAGSAFLALYFAPAMFALMARGQAKRRRRKLERAARRAAAQPAE